jgi:hypothetical protein
MTSDIIEEIIAEEIIDEFDRYEDNQSKREARRRGNAAIMKGIVEHVKRRSTMPEVHLAGDSTPHVASSSPDIESPVSSNSNHKDNGTSGRTGSGLPRAVSSRDIQTPHASTDYFLRGQVEVMHDSPNSSVGDDGIAFGDGKKSGNPNGGRRNGSNDVMSPR